MKNLHGKSVIRLGDEVIHDGQSGKIISASEMKAMGIQVALEGDMGFCAKCNGNFPLVPNPGNGGRSHMGRLLAYDGDLLACGGVAKASF
ncbi:PAAR domain-containing protein [Glaciimonas soli]|uniref:PAAR domain-containing protein n=1 Tax=Glaciimonas soli TaxID=2590999 RepID=A0A843YZ52_9BURK|nr:PAAR domain-containing protein [Glaciimonas soli]MQR02758.1 PAAR domain-containing protein [Glaciimonas soli]